MHGEAIVQADIRSYYLDSQSLQWAVDRWPDEVSAERFLNLLFSESTERVEVVQPLALRKNVPVTFRVHGKCYGNVSCSFVYEAKPSDFTKDEKIRIKNLVKTQRQKIEAPRHTTARQVAVAFGIAL